MIGKQIMLVFIGLVTCTCLTAQVNINNLTYFTKHFADGQSLPLTDGAYNEVKVVNSDTFNGLGYYTQCKKIGVWMSFKNNIIDSIHIYNDTGLHIAEAFIYNDTFFYKKYNLFDHINEDLYFFNCSNPFYGNIELGYCLERKVGYMRFRRYSDEKLSGPELTFLYHKIVIETYYDSGYMDGLTIRYDTAGHKMAEVRYTKGWLNGETILFAKKRKHFLVYRDGNLLYTSTKLKKLKAWGWLDRKKFFYPDYHYPGYAFGDGYKGSCGLKVPPSDWEMKWLKQQGLPVPYPTK
jgi:hypothetical protein